ncbi:MAG: PAS domain S-box protein [Promethearchaeota archaeon]
MNDYEEKYSEIIDIILIELNEVGLIRSINKKGCEILGYEKSELIGQNLSDISFSNNIQNELNNLYQELMGGKLESLKSIETPIITKNGEEKIIYWHFTDLVDKKGKRKGIIASGRDITKSKRIEKKFKIINRSFKMLSEANLLLSTTDSELELFKKLCLIIYKIGGYKLVWVGLVEHNKEKTVRPVAQSGYEKGYIENINITWADTARGQGPTGTSIRTHKYCVAKNILTNPIFEPWREQALKRGYKSSISLPIIIEKDVIGTLNIYSAQEDAFGQEEIDLLLDMVNNLSLVIGKKRNFKKTYEKIKKEQEFFIKLINSIADGVYIVNQNEDLQYVNPVLVKEFGNWEGKKCYEYLHNRKSICPWCKNQQVFSGETVHWEKYYSKMDKTYDLLDTLIINPDGTKSKLQIFRDITERKHNEDKLKKSENNLKDSVRKLNCLFKISQLLDDPNLSIKHILKKTLEIIPQAFQFQDLICVRIFYRDKKFFSNNFKETRWKLSEKVKIGDIILVIEVFYLENKTFQQNESLFMKEIINRIKIIIENKKSIKKIEESEEKYHSLINNITEMVVTINNKGNIIFINSHSNDLFGYPPEELIGLNIFDSFASLVDLKFSREDKLLLNQYGKIQSIEKEIKHKDGHHVIISGKIVSHKNKGKLEYIGLIRDVTKEKQREKDLKIKSHAIESSVNPILMTDLKGFITYVNQALLKEWGYSNKEEIIGLKTKDMFVPMVKDITEKKIKKLHETGVWVDELIGKRKDGTTFNVYLSASTVYDHEKKPIQIMASLIDITERIKSDKLKEEFNQKLEQKVTSKTLELLKEITDRKIIEDKLRKAHFKQKTQINQIHCLYEISKILSSSKVSIKQIFQRTLSLIPPAFQNPSIIHVKIRFDGNDYKLASFIETKWKFSIGKYIHEKLLIIEVFSNEENEFLNEEKKFINEVGERLKSGILRFEIEQEKQLLAKMVKNSPDGIFNFNNKMEILTWNKGAEKIFGYSSEEICGKSVKILVPTDKLKDFILIYKEIRSGIRSTHFETKALTKDGKNIVISLTVSPIKNLDGKIIGAFAIARDFTDKFEHQKLYQEQLLKSSQFKSEFMASMSHELRTPLNSIIGFTDVILERLSGDINAEQEKFLNYVKSSALLLLDLINDILDIAKIESGKVKLLIENVSLSEILRQINTMLKPMYEKKNLKFEVKKINKEKMIQVDRIRFKEIMYNLLSNAIKYTKEGGIKVDIKEEDDCWRFDIIDTGIGIKEEDFDLVFQDFKRIKSEYTSTIEGTGLGLSLTKKLIEIHGGYLSFSSEFGKGSTFTFTIPKNNDE